MDALLEPLPAGLTLSDSLWSPSFLPAGLGSHRSSKSSAQNQQTNSSEGLQVRTGGLPEELKFTQCKEEFEIKAVASS